MVATTNIMVGITPPEYGAKKDAIASTAGSATFLVTIASNKRNAQTHKATFRIRQSFWRLKSERLRRCNEFPKSDVLRLRMGLPLGMIDHYNLSGKFAWCGLVHCT